MISPIVIIPSPAWTGKRRLTLVRRWWENSRVAHGYVGPFSLGIEFQGLPCPPLVEVNRSVRASCEHLRGLLSQIN